jgi:hypothetical protein
VQNKTFMIEFPVLSVHPSDTRVKASAACIFMLTA